MILKLERRRTEGSGNRHSRYSRRVSTSSRFETGRLKLREGRWRVYAIYRDRDGHEVRRRPLKFRL